MHNPLRRYVTLTVVVAIAVTAVQAALISFTVRAYRREMNRRIGEIALSVQALVVEDEVASGRSWPQIEKTLRDRLGDNLDDEMAIYDAQGRLLARSSGELEEVPAALSEADRAAIGPGATMLEPGGRSGLVSTATVREIAGQRLYLLRLNKSFRHASPMLLQLGLGALVLPMLLVGLGGAFAILRLTGRQLSKVDRVLRLMAGGDLSARMSLPVDPDTAGVVLSFNRMAEKVEETVQKLRRSDEIRRQLLADVTHELNTPLTSVLGYLETLCMEDLPLSDERRRSLVHIAWDEAVNLRTLIDDLTTLSRLDAEGLPLERTRVSLGPVAEKVARRLSHLAESRGVPVRTEIDGSVEVRGDRQRLDQVVRNLIENALRHTSPPGDVTVVVRRDGEQAVLEVRDRGTGIAPDDLARLGQRFLRLDRSRARHTGGRGLGLAITVGLVEAHGGKVQFESVLGRGTTVRVRLPLLAPAMGEIAPEGADAAPPVPPPAGNTATEPGTEPATEEVATGTPPPAPAAAAAPDPQKTMAGSPETH